MSKRTGRLESLILRELSLIQLVSKDDKIKEVSFTAVKVAPDMSFAKVFIAARDNNLIDQLNKASSFFRRELSQKLDTKKTPELVFVIDKSVIEGEKIDNLLKKI